MELPSTTVLDFVDNGYSGTNYERPAVQEMLELVRSGRVHCVVCKDFSRFGRNILETGYFIDRVFPLYSVRFIAVTDGYDSDNYKGETGGIDVAFKFLVHEHYSHDLSKKVKSALHVRMKNGESIRAGTVYGYTKGKNGRLEIDDDSATVVRLIFKMVLEGHRAPKIRNHLCAMRHPTPLEHKAIKNGEAIVPKCLWSTAIILRILRSEQYVGTYIAGKYLRETVASSKQTAIDESEWIKIPNHHDAIIGKDEFDKAQELYARRRNSNPRKSREYLLSGIVYCGCCGRGLQYGGARNPVFSCSYTTADPNASCYKMKIKTATLDSMILSVVKKQAEAVINVNCISELQKSNLSQMQIAEHESRISHLTGQRQHIYEQLVLGQINRETYIASRDEYAREIEKLKSQIDVRKQLERVKLEKQKLAGLAEDALSMTEMDSQRGIIESLIEKILVSPNNHIEIVWRFEDFGKEVM